MSRALPAAKPRKIFYGWYVLGVAMVGAFMSGGMTSQLFFGTMLKPITNELGWSRTEVTGAITIGTICAGLMAPLAGNLADRHGSRILAPAGAVVVAIALFTLSNLQTLIMFYVCFIVSRTFAANLITGVGSQTLAANWFRRMRGRAFGMIAMAVPLGGSVGAVAAQPIIDGPGWRSVFIVFPIVMLASFALPALLVYRRRPEDLGLLPDGDAPTDAVSETRKAVAPEISWTLQEALRTRALWLLVGGLFIGTLANGAVSFHLVSYYTDKGLSTGAAATAISTYALCGAAANFVWGFMVERFSERVLLVVAMVMAGSSLLLIVPVQTAGLAVLAAGLYGTAARGEGTLVNTVLAQYYGRESYGRISGAVSPFTMVALGLGPLVASICFDATGSYSLAFVLMSMTYVASAALLWFARRPVHPSSNLG